MTDPLNPIDYRMLEAFEAIFAGRPDPLAQAQQWFYSKLRANRRPVDPTLYATEMLNTAMRVEPNGVLQLCNDMALASRLDDKEVNRVKKQVMEVLRIRNNLAIMLDKTEVADPRQFDLFSQDGGLDIRPEDFA